MTSKLDTWIRDSLDLLAEFQFAEPGLDVLRRAPIELIPVKETSRQRGYRIAIPVDAPAPLQPTAARAVPFGQTELRVWNDLNRPGPDWDPVPAGNPLWWRHESGALVPAWNLWSNVRDILTFREVREIDFRDIHGRLPAEASPRFAPGLLDVPVANDANAALLDAALALESRSAPRLEVPRSFLQPPSVALSHDCDQLRGNDLITQSIRSYRAVRETVAGHPVQAARHLRAIALNAVAPRRFFANNLLGMIDVERQFGFTSVSYFITGEGGRYGARSGNRIAEDIAGSLPTGWDAGVHYNYNTVGSKVKIAEEIARISKAARAPAIAGRAHYLRFDPVSSPRFIESAGLRYDESIGWASHLSYRAGIAGPFYPFDLETSSPVSVLELPLTCMDGPLSSAGFDGGFKRLFKHLQAVGGLVSVLVHPGAFFNSEFPVYTGMYARILREVSSEGGRSWTPRQVLALADKWRLARNKRPAAVRLSNGPQPQPSIPKLA
jgi:hypothetical protein